MKFKLHGRTLTRGLRAAVARALLTLFLALPAASLAGELWPVCTMECSGGRGFCCCRDLGQRPWMPSGEHGAFERHRLHSSPESCPGPVAPREVFRALVSEGSLRGEGADFAPFPVPHRRLPRAEGGPEPAQALFPRPPPSSR
jgi:hypothetical protein